MDRKSKSKRKPKAVMAWALITKRGHFSWIGIPRAPRRNAEFYRSIGEKIVRVRIEIVS